jgi:hypothetical protein
MLAIFKQTSGRGVPLTQALDAKESMSPKLTTAQIGKCGKILVQYRLLLLGIESAPMSTDTGVDLVAYSPNRQSAYTIQVKTNLKPKPGGGSGKSALDWWVPETSPAQFVALVDLSNERVWLLSHAELLTHAQQRSTGRAHIYMYTDPSARPRKTDRFSHQWEFEGFLLANRVHSAFGI